MYRGRPLPQEVSPREGATLELELPEQQAARHPPLRSLRPSAQPGLPGAERARGLALPACGVSRPGLAATCSPEHPGARAARDVTYAVSPAARAQNRGALSPGAESRGQGDSASGEAGVQPTARSGPGRLQHLRSLWR